MPSFCKELRKFMTCLHAHLVFRFSSRMTNHDWRTNEYTHRHKLWARHALYSFIIPSMYNVHTGIVNHVCVLCLLMSQIAYGACKMHTFIARYCSLIYICIRVDSVENAATFAFLGKCSSYIRYFARNTMSIDVRKKVLCAPPWPPKRS